MLGFRVLGFRVFRVEGFYLRLGFRVSLEEPCCSTLEA